ncbi:hypothetical protein FACS1894163_01740 [Spirochaetia bacterium]|nr:hypothetical protein FACS1894163_01740 [Spirochaetia bacterium]
MKKLFVFLAVTAACWAVLLATGCTNTILPTEKPLLQTGLVEVSIGDSAAQFTASEDFEFLPGSTARTLLPSTRGLYYTIGFTAPGKTTVYAALDLTGGGNPSITVTLDAGTWALDVYAYLRSGDIAWVASGRVNQIEVYGGVITPAVVNLTGVTGSGTNTGSLSFNISFPAVVTTATLSYGVIGSNTPPQVIPLNAASTGVVKTVTGNVPNLLTGYYQITVYLSDGTDMEAGKSEVAHIYKGQNTEVAYTFVARDFADIPLPAPPNAAVDIRIPEPYISWDPIPSGSPGGAIDGYRVYRSLSSGGYYTQLGSDISAPDTNGDWNYLDTSAEFNKTYYYKVAGFNTRNEGVRSAELTAVIPPVTALTANTWFHGNAIDDETEYWYSFTAIAGTTYRIELDDVIRSGNPSNPSNSLYLKTGFMFVHAYRASDRNNLVGDADGYKFSCVITLSDTELVYVKVRAYSSYAGTYAVRYFDSSSIKPQFAPNIEVAATPTSNYISWEQIPDLGNNGTGYYVYRSVASGSGYYKMGPFPATSSNYIDPGMSSAPPVPNTFYYTVAAFNEHGEGPMSAEVKAVTPAVTAVFTNPGFLQGNFSPPGDPDEEVYWYLFPVNAGATYEILLADKDANSGNAGANPGKVLVSAYAASDGRRLVDRRRSDSGNILIYMPAMPATDGVYVQVTRWMNYGVNYPGDYAVNYVQVYP